jgi:AraC family transcriptional regulator
MPDHLDVRALFGSPSLSILDVRCRMEQGPGHEEEAASGYDVVFPRSGIFRRHSASGTALADVNQVLFFNRGEPYTVSHPVSGGDRCTVLSFGRETVVDAFGEDHPEKPFTVAAIPTDEAMHRRVRRLGSGAGDPIEVEETSLRLLGGLAARIHRHLNRPGPNARPAAVRRRRERAEAARELLARRYRERLTLADLATAIECSPFHLARIFRSETGVSIHRYLKRLRLREGLERVAEGERDLTALAFELGFSSHAHFTDAFRGEFGRPPSGFRAGRRD